MSVSITDNTNNISQVSGNNNYVSSQELADKYFKNLEKKYPTLNLKKNTVNIHQKDKVTITLSPELIKKACKDKDVDKAIRKSLDDAAKNRSYFKSYNCTKDGQKVSSVSYFIDKKQKISCSIKLKKTNTFDNSEDKKSVSLMIASKFQQINEKSDKETSLTYRYISSLYENNFSTLDVIV